MIVRVKGVLITLGLIALLAAVAGSSHVSAIPRRGLDVPVARPSYATTTPMRAPMVASSPARSFLPLVVDGPAMRGPMADVVVSSPTPSAALPASDPPSICSEPGVGVPERELRDLRYRHVFERQTEKRRVEPSSLPQAANLTPSPSSLDANSAQEAPTPATPAASMPTPLANPTTLLASEAGGGRWIDVDLTHQLLTAYEGNSPVHTTAVSTGLPGTPTPVGQFRIWVKLRYDDMEGPGYYLPDVPYTMYFYRGYGLHGTYWHSNFGFPMSHGCVNLPTPEAEWLFDWAQVGTLVNVHN